MFAPYIVGIRYHASHDMYASAQIAADLHDSGIDLKVSEVRHAMLSFHGNPKSATVRTSLGVFLHIGEVTPKIGLQAPQVEIRVPVLPGRAVPGSLEDGVEGMEIGTDNAGLLRRYMASGHDLLQTMLRTLLS
jgi:hypothetical protein